MHPKNILLYTNPEFDKRLKYGISKLYQIFFVENNITIQIINTHFLTYHEPKLNEVLIIAGGDGTIHKAINVIPKEYLCNYLFGIIPAGTANEFAKSLSLPISIEECANIIVNSKKITTHQLGIVDNKHLFLTGFLYGMACATLKITPNYLKRIFKGYAYSISAIKLLFNLLNNKNLHQNKFIINNREFLTSYLLINNASLISKNIQQDELSSEDSNCFSLITLKPDLNVGDLISLHLKKNFLIGFLKEPKLNYSQQKEIVIEFDDEITYLLDGEEYSSKKFLTINHYSKLISIINA